MIQPSAAGSLVGRENEVCIIELEWVTDSTTSVKNIKTFSRISYFETPKLLKCRNNVN
jgi:hypothetical protein